MGLVRRTRYLLAALLWTAVSHASVPPPSVEEILAKAIERQRLHEDEGRETLFDYELASVTEKLDNDGDVKETEHELYLSHHIDGVPYERLAEKDGRPLNEKEEREEQKREKKFREKLAEGNARDEDSDERVAFDDELIARYEFTHQETRPVDGRETYVLQFRPKPGKLPKKKKIDGVLNKASGTLFVDAKTFEIARLEFDLKDKVRLWWGMLGSVSRMSGKLDRGPVGADVWLPMRFDFYMRGRILFRSLHLRQQVSWTEFKRRGSSTTTDNHTKENQR